MWLGDGGQGMLGHGHCLKESKLHQLEKALCPPRLPRLQREEQILTMAQEPGACFLHVRLSNGRIGRGVKDPSPEGQSPQETRSLP